MQCTGTPTCVREPYGSGSSTHPHTCQLPRTPIFLVSHESWWQNWHTHQPYKCHSHWESPKHIQFSSVQRILLNVMIVITSRPQSPLKSTLHHSVGSSIDHDDLVSWACLPLSIYHPRNSSNYLPHPQISFYWTITWVWIEEKCSSYQSQLSIPFLFLPLFSMICPVWIVWVWKNCNLWQGVFQLASYTTRFKDRKVYIPNWCGIVALVLTSILCLGRQRNGITKHIMNLVWPPTLNFLFISRALVLSFWCFLLREIKGVGVRCLICSHWNNKWSRWPKSVCTASQWQALSDTPVWLAKLTTPEATTTTTMIMLATTITAASCWPKFLCTASQALSDTSAISNDNNNRN